PTNALTRNERPPSRESAPELAEATRQLRLPPNDNRLTALHKRASSANQLQVVQPAVSTPLGAEDTPARRTAPVVHSVVTKAQTRVEKWHPRAGNFLLALLVLMAACGAAAVVYFALPYVT